MLEALAYLHNQVQSQLQTDGYHRDVLQVTQSPVFNQSFTVTTVSITATSTDGYLASAVTLANQCLAVFTMHCADDQAHLLQDFTDNPTLDGYTPAVDLPSLIVVVNALKALFTAHLTASGVHVHNDTTAYGLPANATTLVSATTLANALKTAINTHIANAGTVYTINRIKLIQA